MKRALTILLFVAVLIAGGSPADAKTTRKKSSSSAKSGTSASSSAQVLYIIPEDLGNEVNLPIEKVTINRNARTVRIKLKGKAQEKVHKIDFIDEDIESPGYYFVDGGTMGVYLYDGEISYSPDGFKMGYYEIDVDKSGLKSLLLDDCNEMIIGHSYALKEDDIITVLTFKNDRTVIWQAIIGGESKSTELDWEYEGSGTLNITIPGSGKYGFYFDDESELYVLDKYGKIRYEHPTFQLIK